MKVFTLLTILFTATGFWQPPTAKDLVGVWKVSDINVQPGSPLAANSAAVAKMKPIVMNLVFDMRANHHFIMKGSATGQQMPEGLWQYNASTNIIKVTKLNDSNSRLANIYVNKNKQGQYFFTMMDTPLTLEVHK